MNFDKLNPLSIKTTNAVTQVHFIFDGPAGDIEALLSVPENYAKQSAAAIVCHPHPLHGGSLSNKVTHFIAKSFNELNVPALRFNFRGVGKSQGIHDNAVGEREDLLAAVNYVGQLFPNREVWLAGFSFGAYIALSCATECHASKLVTVAPAVHLYDFNQIQLPAADWLLIQGDADEIVPPEQALQWARSLESPPTIAILKQAGHFFHGRLNDLRETIISHISENQDTPK